MSVTLIRLTFILAFGLATQAMAFVQQPPKTPSPAPPTAPTTPPAAAQNPDKKKEIPPSESINIETKDRVSLKCEWYPGVNEKDTVPIILLHDWASNRSTSMVGLAASLQKEVGCAVIVPDWRGHGESTQVVGAANRLDHNEFGNLEITSMGQDIETCKKFLMGKNNEGKLNINMLCVVAAHNMTPHALTWAVGDWSFPPLGGKRQGQDVKAVVLLSPIRKFKNFNITNVVRAPVLADGNQPGITTCLIWDARSTESDREASAIEKMMLKTLGPQPNKGSDPVKYWTSRRLFSWPVESAGTAEVGEELLAGQHSEGVKAALIEFINKKFVEQKDEYTWEDRSN